MNKKIVAAALVFSVSSIQAPVAHADPVQDELMRVTVALESSIITTYGDDFWGRVVGVATSYVECQSVLVGRVIKYGKFGVCVPDPRRNGTWLAMLT